MSIKRRASEYISSNTSVNYGSSDFTLGTDNIYATTVSSHNMTLFPQSNIDSEWINKLILILKSAIMILIIVAAIFGNLLVIISVMRHRKLR